MVAYEIELVDLAPQHVAIVCGHVTPPELPEFLGAAFDEVRQALGRQGLAPAGPPFGRYRPTRDGFDVEAGFPATGPVKPSGRVTSCTLPGGPAARALHRGAYTSVGAAYAAVADWLGGHGFRPAGEPWESYLDDPEVAEPRTLVHQPCRTA